MHRFALAVLFAPLTVLAAEPPDFSRGAMSFGIQFGTGMWQLDGANLASQVDPTWPGDSQIFVNDARNGPSATLRLGYNILGHATIEAALTGTGWNVFDASRGGAGFLAGVVHWHPMQLIWRDQPRPVPFDASLFFGVGYGIAGQNRGMDGRVLEAGGDATYYLSKAVGIGLFARDVMLQFNKYYQDYDGKILVELPKGSGGSFWTFGVALDFRFET